MQVPKTMKRVGLIGVPMLLASTMLIAQQQQTPPPAPANPQNPTFRTTVYYVSNTVIVRDKSGKFIPDLKQSEFKLYEDGVEQKIQVFTPWIGGRAMGSVASVPENKPVRSEGLIFPQQRVQSDQSGRIFIIFIDDMHIPALDSPRVKDLLGQIRDNLVHENDLVGFVSTGYSSIQIDLSYDFKHRRFNEAITKLMGSGMKPDEIIEAAQTAEGPVGIRYNAHVAFGTAYDILEQLEKVTDRRKSFIYVSEGYHFDPFRNARYKLIQEKYGYDPDAQKSDGSNSGDSSNSGSQQTDPLDDPYYRQGNAFAEADLVNELAQLVNAAKRSNVTFYTIDPRGLNAGPDIGMNNRVDPGEWRDFITETVGSLKVLGDNTGGFCICEQNDFKKGIQRIDNDTSDYYLIGYTSNNPDPLRLRRQVKIEVTRPGVGDVQYNPDYVLKKTKAKK